MAFYPCEKLKDINVDKNNLYFSSNDGILFDKNQTALIICPQGHQGNYDIPTSVKLIKKGAFFSRLLNSINIPSSVNSIENEAISFCNASVFVDVNNPKYSSKEGVLYNKDQTELLFCPSSKSKFTIPVGVKTIGDGAFGGCGNLTSVTIPNSVTSIGNYAFNSCQGIENVEIPSSVTSIGESAFTFCYKLSSIKIPSSVSYIGDWALNSCTKLTSITVGQIVPLRIEKNVFKNFDKNLCTLYVPYGSRSAYQTADQWKDFINIVEMPFDHDPYLKNPFQNISAKPGAKEQVIDLKTIFADNDLNDIITYSVVSNTNDKIATTKLDGANLVVTFSSTEIGNTEISIAATSNGKQIQSNFKVNLGFPTLNDQLIAVENKVYPNPTSDKFKVRLSNIPNDGILLNVTDLTGRPILNKVINHQEEWIDLKGQTPGVYLVRVNLKGFNIQKVILK